VLIISTLFLNFTSVLIAVNNPKYLHAKNKIFAGYARNQQIVNEINKAKIKGASIKINL
jgi:hypothetical protein